MDHVKGALFFLMGAFQFSCGEASSDVSPVPITGRPVFILCEGNFGARNSSLTLLDTVMTDSTYHDVFQRVNGHRLGDFAHAMVVHDSIAYIAVTGSDRVEMVDAISFESLGRLDGVAGPRDVAVYNSRLFVTCYHDSSVAIFGLTTLIKEQVLDLPYRPNEIEIISGTAFVTASPNSPKDTILHFFDADVPSEVGSIHLSRSPVAIAANPDDNIFYVGCDSAGYIARIDAGSKEVLSIFSESTRIQDLAVMDSVVACIDASSGNVRIFNGQTGLLIASLNNAGGNYRGVDFGDGELFAIDALDFLSKGSVTWFSKDFKTRRVLRTGRAPSQVAFVR